MYVMNSHNVVLLFSVNLTNIAVIS